MTAQSLANRFVVRLPRQRERFFEMFRLGMDVAFRKACRREHRIETGEGLSEIEGDGERGEGIHAARVEKSVAEINRLSCLRTSCRCPSRNSDAPRGA